MIGRALWKGQLQRQGKGRDDTKSCERDLGAGGNVLYRSASTFQELKKVVQDYDRGRKMYHASNSGAIKMNYGHSVRFVLEKSRLTSETRRLMLRLDSKAKNKESRVRLNELSHFRNPISSPPC